MLLGDVLQAGYELVRAALPIPCSASASAGEVFFATFPSWVPEFTRCVQD